MFAFKDRLYLIIFIGLGIDMSEDELKTVADELEVTDGCLYFDQFVQFMVSRTQIRDTFEELLASFIALSNGKVTTHTFYSLHTHIQTGLYEWRGN